jgi:exosortase
LVELQGLRAEPMPWAFVAGVPLAVAWLGAERLGIMEGRQLIVMSFVELLFFAVLGWTCWRRVSGPLLYLYFLVPFGDFLTGRLQDVTTVFTRVGLQVLQIPAFIDGYTIEIPEGTFYVAEACAGLRFLIASIAFGCLYALIMYRSPWRRVAFVGISIIVPIIANGFRALGIVALGHVLGSAQAAAADHVLYGWIFFSLVILLLIALGLPFREDQVAPRKQHWIMPARSDHRMRLAIFAAVMVSAMAAVSPVVAVALNRSVVAPADAVVQLEPGVGCINLPVPQQIAVGTPGRLSSQQVACGPALFNLKVEVFSPRTTAGPVMAERRRLTRMPDAEDVAEDWLVRADGDSPHVWRILRASQPAMAMAAGIWIGGEPAQVGLTTRLHMALTSLTGSRFAPVLVTVAPAVDWSRLSPLERLRAEKNLSEFLLSHPELAAQVKAMAAVRG